MTGGAAACCAEDPAPLRLGWTEAPGPGGNGRFTPEVGGGGGGGGAGGGGGGAGGGGTAAGCAGTP